MKELNRNIAVMLGSSEKKESNYWEWPEKKVVCFMNPSDSSRKDREKIEEFRKKGYTVRIWKDEDFSCFERIDHTFKQLRNDLHLPDATRELDLYENRRRALVQRLFGVE